jgi:hypothetical protein
MNVDPEGVLRFNLEIKVELAEMKEWPVGCVQAFFDCIAKAREATVFAREEIALRRGSRA